MIRIIFILLLTLIIILGDVLKRVDDNKFIVKASSGPRYVVGCRTKLDQKKLMAGTRVALGEFQILLLLLLKHIYFIHPQQTNLTPSCPSIKKT